MSSPSLGNISPHGPQRLVRDYVGAGAAAISVLTEPNRFRGSLDSLLLASAEKVPLLMKDIIVSSEQIRAGATRGASAVLLIEGAFNGPSGHRERDRLIAYAHKLDVEVVLEAGRRDEIDGILGSDADILGLNQRDLRSLDIDTGMGARLLPDLAGDGRPVVVMSGIGSREQVKALRDAGADAILVGTSLSSSPDPGAKLRSMAVPR